MTADLPAYLEAELHRSINIFEFSLCNHDCLQMIGTVLAQNTVPMKKRFRKLLLIQHLRNLWKCNRRDRDSNPG